MSQYIIGIDNGGTVSKAAVFDIKGTELSVASRQTPVFSPRPGYAERDMDALWKSNCCCVKQAVEQAGIHPEDVAAVAVCGHGKGLYAWGKNGRPAYNGIVSTDNRAWKYPEKWRMEGTFEALYPQLCQQLIACQQAALLAWLKDHNRSVYDNIRYAFSVKDYIRYRLTGEAYCEVTDISGSGLMDIKNARFDRDMLERMGIAEAYEMLAPLKCSQDRCGSITAEAAALTGLRQGTPVAGGMFDIDACAIAMSVTRPEELCTITGTWSINEFISKTPITGTKIAMNSLYAIPGYYLIEECSATSAGNLEWIIEQMYQNEPLPPEQELYDYLNELVASIPVEESEVYFLPFLNGSNAHPLAKASFVGLTSFHTKAHMLRAVYEGVAYSAKTHVERLLSVRESPQTIRMAGGAAKSPTWVQMFADVLELPVETVQNVRELGALGCAMAAAVCVGIYPNYQTAAKHMVRVSEPVLPDPEKVSIYRRKYEKYTAIKEALDNLWSKFEV